MKSYGKLMKDYWDAKKFVRDQYNTKDDKKIIELFVEFQEVCPHDWYSLFDRITDRWYNVPY